MIKAAIPCAIAGSSSEASYEKAKPTALAPEVRMFSTERHIENPSKASEKQPSVPIIHHVSLSRVYL